MAVAQNGGGIENSGMDEYLLKYKEKDNVKDKLKELQDEITKKNKTKPTDKLNEGKTKSAFENLDSFAELKFDSFVQDNRSHVKDLLNKKENTNLADEFNNKILNGSDFKTYFDQLKDFEINANITNFKFEINDLRNEVQKEINKNSNSDVEIDKFDNNNTYSLKEDKFNLNEKGPKGYIKFDSPDMSFNNDDLIDVFDKSGLKKEIENVIGEDLGGLNKRNFKINLSPQNGLAGLVSYIDSNNPKLRDQIKSGKDIKNLEKGGIHKDKNGSGNDIDRGQGFEYDRQGGRDGEKHKIAKIIEKGNDDQTFQKALIKFADRSKGFGPEYQKRFKQGANFQTNIEQLDITENNILQSLCDFNGDGKLAVNYHEYQARSQFRNERKQSHQPLPNDRREQRKKAREQHKQEGKNNKKERKGIENQGDVGTIFGPQLYDAVDTAIQVGEIKIQNKDENIIKKYPQATSGENIVIYNIIQNIRIFNENPELEEKLKNFSITQCNKLELFNLINTDDNALDFQPLFAKAIETINGSSSALAPNLVDRLLGIDRLIEDNIPTASFENYLDAYCKERWKNTEQGKNFLSKYEDGLLTMKESLIDLFGFVDVDAMLNDEGKLLGLGISKSRDLQRRKHEIENSFVKTFLGPSVSIGIDPTTGKVGFDLSMNYGQTGSSESLKSKRSRNTSIGAFGISLEEGKVSIIPHISIGGEKDRQINYKNIVTAPLDINISSKYIGIEGGISGGLVGPVLVGTVEGGIVYSKDPKAAIEQMYKQYNDITSLIFNLNGATKNNIKDGVSLENFLTKKYDDTYNKYNIQNDNTGKLISKFMRNNEIFLKTNIKEIVKYMDLSGILATLNSPNSGIKDSIKAASSFINIMQKGITNSRRETKYEQLSGSYNISKIGVGGGAIVVPGMEPIPYPKFSLQVSRRSNNYLPDKAQKNIDAFLINQGTIDEQTDIFQPSPPTIKAYGDYFNAIFNIKKFDKIKNKSESLLETGETNGKLYIKYLGTDVSHISEIIDIRAKGKQNVLDNVQFKTDPTDGKSMIIIGNVGKISAFTQSDGGGKRCFLVLGGYGTNATCILPKNHNENKTTDQIEKFDLGFQKTGEYKERNKAQIQSDIINKIKNKNTNININDATKTEKAKTTIGSFFDADGTIKNPDLNKTIVNDPNDLIGTKLSTGTFTIEKAKSQNGGKDEYTISLDTTTPTDKLKIDYIDKADDPDINTLTNNTNNYQTNTEITFDSSTDFFSIDKYSELKEAQTIIDGLKNKLRDLEKDGTKNKDAYLKFMYYISNIDLTETNPLQIDDKEIQSSIEELSKPEMLGGAEFTKLKEILNDKNTNYLTKSRILDQLKSIFAKQESFYGKTINEIVDGRGDSFATTLFGPSGENFSSKLQKELIDNKQKILKKYGKDKFKENPDPEKNLIGYTAFYRQGNIVKNQNKRYSMTCIGQTTIQGEAETIVNQSDAIDRFTNNLKANKYEMELFKNIIKDHTKFTLTDEEIINLLKNPNQELSIDNGTKKITLKSDYVFYLLGECCNESVGMRIKSIQTKEIKPELLNQGFTAEGTSEEISTGPGVGGVNASNAMKVGSYDKTYGVSVAMVKTKAPQNDNESNNQGLEEESNNQGVGDKAKYNDQGAKDKYIKKN